MQSHPLIFCITFCISIGLIFFPLNPQYTFRSVPHINFFLFEAEFSLMFVKANAGAEDKYYIAGHVFRIISCLNQVLFACNNAYCINEKKAIKLLETFEYKPEKYAERVNHIFEVLGLSLFECYDMTEKLYKEVKKIATEINNFLNEGEFR